MRTAVVGLGWWGKQITRCLAESDKIAVTHGVDPVATGLDDFAAEFSVAIVRDFDEVLANPEIDAVIIATPHSMHEEQVVKAAGAGKQVFCEKPLALTSAGARRMIEACRKAGIVLGLGHERRWEPAMEELHRLATEGVIGKLLHVETNFSHDIFARLESDNWRLSASDAPAGGMTALGIHLTDFMVSLVGPASSIHARAGSVAFKPPRIDTLAVHMTFASGITGLLAVLITTPFYGRFTVFGDQGWIELREISNVDVDDPAELIICNADGKRNVTLHPVVNTVKMNFEAWADAVAGHGDYRIRPAEMIANIEILEAIVASSRSGEIVKIG